MKEKPVLWQWLDTVQVRKKVPDCFIKSDWRPLYKTPQTKPLSDEEIEKLALICSDMDYGSMHLDAIKFARAIEKEHGIK